jgi:hypothetical protein
MQTSPPETEVKQNIVTFLLFVGASIIIGIWASETEQLANATVR